MQLLCNRYFEVLVNHKAIEYMIKSKAESPSTRLKTLLLKLSEYTIDLKYQKGSEMHASDALSRLQNIVDMPDNKDVIPLNFLQHLTPNYIEHAYSHLKIFMYTKQNLWILPKLKENMVGCPKQSQKIQTQTQIPQQLQLLTQHDPAKLLKFQAVT